MSTNSNWNDRNSKKFDLRVRTEFNSNYSHEPIINQCQFSNNRIEAYNITLILKLERKKKSVMENREFSFSIAFSSSVPIISRIFESEQFYQSFHVNFIDRDSVLTFIRELHRNDENINIFYLENYKWPYKWILVAQNIRKCKFFV